MDLNRCHGHQNDTSWNGHPRPAQCWVWRSKARDLCVLICRMGSQHHLVVGRVRRRARPGLSSHRIRSRLHCQRISPEVRQAGGRRTERLRQLYKHPWVVLM